jgi:hypothetical protein
MSKAIVSETINPVLGGDDGYLFVRRLEDEVISHYLEVYSAKIAGYKVQRGEKAANVTMKIEFPLTDNEANVGMWAWFIAKAAHPSAQKPKTTVKAGEQGLVAYVTWPIWNEVRYMESKNQGGNRFDF